jgi:hypothetical protein
MTAKAALAMALLEGRVLNVKNCFNEIGLTNIAREIPRLIEKPFGVQVSRTPKSGKSRFNQDVTWTDYRLNTSPFNSDGIEKMKEYVKVHTPVKKTLYNDPIKFKQTNLFD